MRNTTRRAVSTGCPETEAQRTHGSRKHREKAKKTSEPGPSKGRIAKSLPKKRQKKAVAREYSSDLLKGSSDRLMPEVSEEQASPKSTVTIQPRRFERIHRVVEQVEFYRKGGYHPVKLRDVLHDDYHIEGKLGFGQSSTVWLAYDRRSHRPVALKLLQAKTSKETQELQILRQLRRKSSGRQHITDLIGHFYHTGPNGRHLCLVFPVLSTTVANLPLKAQFQSAAFLRKMSSQLLYGLDYLHTIGIIHCDIEPANLMLLQPSSAKKRPLLEEPEFSAVTWLPGLKPDRSAPEYLISPQRRQAGLGDADAERFRLVIGDFGGAILQEEEHPATPVTPLALRSPEIIHQHPWSSGIDIWAGACVLFQLATREPLFDFGTCGRSIEAVNTEHLRLIRETLNEDGLEGRLRSTLLWSSNDLTVFAKFLRLMLEPDPENRLDALKLLGHTWIQPWNESPP